MSPRADFQGVLLIAALICCCGASERNENAGLPNPDFTQGTDTPTAWRLAEGQGRWINHEILEVTGDGTDSGFWRCETEFSPGALYRFQARGRGTPTGGSAIVGPVFANRDYRTPSTDWTWVGHVFRVPDNVSQSLIRLGHWRASGSIQYDAVRMQRVIPVHQMLGPHSPITLGDGERIQDGRYSFLGTYGHEGSNYHRPLQSTTASFNSDRWTMGPNQEIVYAFQIPGSTFRNGQLSFHVNYFTRGGCTVQVRSDTSDDWIDLGTQSDLGTLESKLPDSLFPTLSLMVRLTSSTDETSLQVNRIEFSADLDNSPPDAIGQTVFAAIESEIPTLSVQRMSLVSDNSASGKLVEIELKNDASKDLHAKIIGTVSTEETPSKRALDGSLSITPGTTSTLSVPLVATAPGTHQLHLMLNSENDAEGTSSYRLNFDVPEFYRTDYGAQISCEGAEALNLWWCPATHKVPRQRAIPERQSTAAELSAARNDFEAVQIVLQPEEDVQGLTVQATDFVGPEGARLSADQVSILRVAYHFVRHPTDRTGVVDHWPDA